MKSVEKILEMLCVILTVVFFGTVAVMVLCQAVSLGMMNGAMSVYFSDLIAEPASMVAAVATIIAMILGYIRGQMKS